MREKPTCSICYTKFTRKWNMKKHMQNIHNVFEVDVGIKNVRSFPREKRLIAQPFETGWGRAKPPITGLDQSLERLSNLTKVAADYASTMNIFQESADDKRKIAMYQNEINWIKSNNWIVPNSQTQGLSGYVCRRCNLIGFLNIQDIGYDMTMQAKHRCNEAKVKSIRMCSIRPSDIWHLNDFAAKIMLDRLNCIMPGQKYLLAEDISYSFNSIEKALNTEIAKLLWGIPDRYYFYSLGKDERIAWLDRSVSNVGKKTIIEDFEIKELLRKVKSTYAIFEIPILHVLRKVLIKITA